MVSPDLKTAIRNIFRNRVQSVISILGLGIGLGCTILLLALILHETSFDKFIPDHRDLYRIMYGGSSGTQYPLAEKMENDFPEVKDYFRFYQANDIQLHNTDRMVVRDNNFGFADPSIFRILGIKVIAGNAASAVSEVAVSESTALKYFNNSSPIGSVLSVRLNNKFVDLSVCGVYKDFPSTSTLFPNFIANIKLSKMMFRQFQSSLGEYGNDKDTELGWQNGGYLSYVLLQPNTDIRALASKVDNYRELLNNQNAEEINFTLQPVTDIYLRSGQAGANPACRSGNPQELKYYEIISLIILLISVTNYILLARAGAADRLKEFGTRKVLGATGRTILSRMILESNIVAIVSLIPAMLIIRTGMTFIDTTLNKTLGPDIFSNPYMWLLLVAVVLFTGFASGSLIGIRFSGIPSLLLLSGKTAEKYKKGKWNYSFLVLHFSIYVILLISVIAVTRQIKYSMTNFQGIDPENILVSDLSSPDLKAGFNSICDEMKKVPGVKAVAGASFIPPFGAFLPVTLATPQGDKVRFDGMIMGKGMTELLGIKVIEGEPFGPFNPGRREVLFNESSAKEYNIKAGEIYMGFYVKGIVKDFHAHSLHSLIQPMVILQQSPERMGLLAIKTDGKNDAAIIKKLKNIYSQYAPDQIFEVSYLSDRIYNFYSNERNQDKIIGLFAVLAALLSAMGLFGIAMITIARKTKEIGLRKVNGATIPAILALINRDFLRWVLLSFLISVPASVYIINSWQNRFAYKATFSWWIFAAACVSALLIATLTVSGQSLRAATRNPADALRYE
ncbi:MAG TPA: ABC transporter permease [Bacteroidales bacterium]|nr:ABC transporter permease [Bacteroidales bacterium]